MATRHDALAPRTRWEVIVQVGDGSSQGQAPAQDVGDVDRQVFRGRAILLVEERPDVARNLQLALERAGAEVLQARDAAQALAFIDQFNFFLAIVDWRPDGEEQRIIARRLQEEGVRFLFCAQEPPEVLTTRRGAPFIAKSAKPEEIVKALALLAHAAPPHRGLRSRAGSADKNREQMAKLYAGQMGISAVLLNVLIDKGVISQSELVERFKQARAAATQCRGGREIAIVLEDMLAYLAPARPEQ
jgi:CheY-like chemotaxis protein